MAQVYYQMGQYRYNGSDKLLHELNCTVNNLDWQFETDTSPWYRDFYISLEKNNDNQNGTFEVNQSYYLTFSLPRDLNYSLSFALKFIKTDSIQDSEYIYSETATPFQFIRYLEVPRSYTNGTHNSLVCLYKIDPMQYNLEDPNPRIAISNKVLYTDEQINGDAHVYLNTPYEETKSTINSGVFYEVRNPEPGFVYKAYVLYHNRVNDTYCMFKTNKTVTQRDGKTIDPWDEGNILEGDSDAVLNWRWEMDSVAEYVHYKILITPRKADYDGLLFQMKRIQEDGDIINEQIAHTLGGESTGKNLHGRFVNLDKQLKDDETGTTVRNSFKLYKMQNLNETLLDSKGTNIHRFGIWSHPELMMAVDGEQILVGQSGYYELNDYETSKLCIAAVDSKDAFVLDYQYRV